METTNTKEKKPGFWDDAPIIHRITRADLLADGSLIDVSRMAREAGITCPVAVTAGVMADINDIPESQSHQCKDGRLWDVLWMFRCNAANAPKGMDTFCYKLIMHMGRRTYYTVKAVIGPGDKGEAVITLMQPHES